MNSSVEQWKSAASNADAKAALETGCKAALDAMKTSLASYNCEW